MAVPALGYGILTLAIASKRAAGSSQAAPLWWAAASWGLGLGAHMLVWKYSTVKSEFETREPFCLGGIQFHLGQKKAPRPLLTSEKGNLQQEPLLTAIFYYFLFFPLGGRNPLLGHTKMDCVVLWKEETASGLVTKSVELHRGFPWV